jgi:hypothetical protein
VQTGKGSVKVERSEPKGNLDGFLAGLHASQKNEGKSPKAAALGRSLNGTSGRFLLMEKPVRAASGATRKRAK